MVSGAERHSIDGIQGQIPLSSRPPLQRRSGAGSYCSARTLFLVYGLITLAVVSCTPHLSFIRQENASAVLTMYRARSLAAANNGNTDLSLNDCIRLGLANSLDLQAALWEEQVRTKLTKGALVRMFPKVQSGLDMTQRDRLPFSRSDVIDQEGAYEVVGPGPGTGVTNWSNAREHPYRAWNVQVNWSPMDALMARYLSEIRCNEQAHSRYQRVRVAQQLIGTITAAFYRLVALNEALPKAQALDGHHRRIVRDLDSLMKHSLVEAQEYLTAKSQQAEAANLLADIYLNIGKQRELLAVAMNICPDSLFQVIGSLMPLPPTPLEPCKLESIALINRPEAYQSDLTHLNSIADYRRLIVKFFPRAEGFIGYFRDENKFLYNKNWTDGGLKVTWDLMEFAANVMEHGAAQDRIAKTERERAVISMGIISQVKLKTLDAIKALERFKKMSDLRDQAKEAMRIAQSVEEVKEQRSHQKLMLIAREKALANFLQAETDQLLALGEVQAAMAELDTAVGTNYPVSEAFAPPRSAAYTSVFQRPFKAVREAAALVGGFLPH